MDKLNNSAFEAPNSKMITAKRQGSLWDVIHEERAAEEHKIVELREMKRRQNTLKTAQENLDLQKKKITLKLKQSLYVQDEKNQI